ncbi:MAG: hypothetical protein ACREQX_18315 [Candidatus Binataceae bacterium]
MGHVSRPNGHHDGFDVGELEPTSLAPVEELFYRARVGHARIAVADAGGEKLDEASAGALTPGVDNGGQRLQAGADQRRRRRDFVGQQDRLFCIVARLWT